MDTGNASVADAGSTGDAGIRDAVVTDGGVFDAAPLPTYDAGASYDGGVVAPQTISNSGLVSISETRALTGSEVTAKAEFYDNSAAMHTVVIRDYPLGNEGSCRLSEVRVAAGTVSGLTADRIEITAPVAFHQPTGGMVVLTPRGNGAFGTNQQFDLPFFLAEPGMVDFRIVGTGMPGSLDSVMASTSRPVAMNVSEPPTPSAPFLVRGSGMVQWSAAQQGQAVSIILSDASGGVTLDCDARDDGEFTIPLEARLGWLLAGPAPPGALEVRYDSRSAVTVGINGSMAGASVVFQASFGARFSVL